MKLIYNALNLLIFIWGTLCLDGFRVALKYNALGEYTESNIDINTLISITVLNTLMIVTNFTDNMFFFIWNTTATLLLSGINMYYYSTCYDSCKDFYSEGRFYFYLAFYSILPYVQLALGALMLITFMKSGSKFSCRGSLNNENECNESNESNESTESIDNDNNVSDRLKLLTV